MQALGLVDGRVIVVAYTERKNEEIRVISARRATPKEARRFFEELGF